SVVNLPECRRTRLVFGHSHVPMCQWHDGLLFFNPGSTTDRRGTTYESVGVLEIDNGMISGRIIPLAG
ncbi:MAG: metallophosphoesterase family protein, partial [Candidatus Moduliflexus flocculans]|nr:metallophosphoesterase family protein [Candidatus Moduliflexus flocculans]